MSEAEGPGSSRNRRRHVRCPYQGPVIVVNSGEVETVSARDLGAGGIFLHASTPPPVGARVQVEFSVGKDRRFSIWGTVVRQDRGSASRSVPGFAVEFDAPADVQRRLSQALSDL